MTHGVGLLLSVAGGPVLVVLAYLQGSALHAVSAAVYTASLIILYGASTLYHAFQRPRVKAIMRVVDHAAIYALIAGTYTPVTLVSLQGRWGWVLFAVVWALALAGILYKLFFIDRFRWFSNATYLAMGWLVVVALKPVIAAVSLAGLLWFVAGGLFYTVGIVFFEWERLPYNHAVWHLFVLAGSVCHYIAILGYVLA